MAILLIAVGAVWALIGAADIVGMKGWGDNSATGVLAFGLVFNGVLFVIPGLILCGIGAGLRRRKGSTSRSQSARGIEATKTCPKCAETVKAAAKICRYCRYEFDDAPAAVEKPAGVGTAFIVGSRVMHAHRGAGEVTTVAGDSGVVMVKFDNQPAPTPHLTRDLKPL